MYYGIITSNIKIPNRREHFSKIVLGFDNREGYSTLTMVLGAIIGRYANQIKNDNFTIQQPTFSYAG